MVANCAKYGNIKITKGHCPKENEKMADFFDDQNNTTEDDDIITLYNQETDKDENFYHLATLDVDDRWFVVMKPVEKLDDIEEDEVLIYEIVENEDGNDVFNAIEDEDLLQRVFDEFMAEVEKLEAQDECSHDCSCCHHDCN